MGDFKARSDAPWAFYRHDLQEATTSNLCPGFPVKFEW